MNKKEIATQFLQMASAGNVREAYEKYIHPDFRHHNAYYKGDRETLLKGVEELKWKEGQELEAEIKENKLIVKKH